MSETKFWHDVQVNLVNQIGEPENRWRLALDGFDLKGVVDLQIKHSIDSQIVLVITMAVGSVKGFNE